MAQNSTAETDVRDVWTVDEDLELLLAYSKGATLTNIAQYARRPLASVVSRLTLLGGGILPRQPSREHF